MDFLSLQRKRVRKKIDSLGCLFHINSQDRVCSIFSWRGLITRHFFSSVGMRLFAKIKNKKHSCRSTTHYLKLQMPFSSGVIFWVHSSLGTTVTFTFGPNLKVSGGKWCVQNYSGKKHKNSKGEKWSHSLEKEMDAKPNFRVTIIFPFELLCGWGCVQSVCSSSKLILYRECMLQNTIIYILFHAVLSFM